MNVTNPTLWGPPLWDLLHYITFNYCHQDSKKVQRLFEHHLPNLMPCKHCREHYKSYIINHPIQLKNKDALSRWLVGIHNLTNKQLGKKSQEFTRVARKYMSPRSKQRAKESFIEWNKLMRPNVSNGPLYIQRSYSAFISYILNYV